MAATKETGETAMYAALILPVLISITIGVVVVTAVRARRVQGTRHVISDLVNFQCYRCGFRVM